MISNLPKMLPAVGKLSQSALSKCFRHAQVRQYWRRNNMVPEVFSVMESFQNQMRNMERDMKRAFDDVCVPSVFSPFGMFRSKNIPVITTDDGGRKYRIEVDLEGLQPEDISITLKDNILTIQGKKEEKKESSSFHRECNYKYNVPEEVNPDSIRSLFKNGILAIEADLPQVKDSEPKEIPIQKDNSKE